VCVLLFVTWYCGATCVVAIAVAAFAVQLNDNDNKIREHQERRNINTENKTTEIKRIKP
jgi:hypothetical protein